MDQTTMQNVTSSDPIITLKPGDPVIVLDPTPTPSTRHVLGALVVGGFFFRIGMKLADKVGSDLQELGTYFAMKAAAYRAKAATAE